MRLRIVSKLRKYEAVGVITMRHQLAYVTDFVLRSLFLLLILYVFIQLWSAAYAGDTEAVIAGFTLQQIVWYLVFTESLTMASPRLAEKVEAEVKQGDIATRLLRPLSYTGYHLAAYLGEAGLRFLVHLAVGSLIAWLFVGPPDFGLGLGALALLAPGSFVVAFLLLMTVALCAFWVEETRGLEFVLQKLKFTVGGMLLPLEMMPDWLQSICAWLPFQAVLYVPARMAVSYDAELLRTYLLIQWGWVAVLGAVVMLMYRRGVSKLHVNGG
ncbi:ABC transporter permease [Paenibacillus sp. 598K]|uniref:ABC transporter permease n=1 Tax=Paenibacillus sp. 598K TaxID=1117987 RepID=UPI000FF9E5D5|nr:ABC-2 family transporter protein [Paenibacillus sp. 598K]GBF75504.1 ABC transporter permease [Paenibacillus sp. 598K]